MVDTPLRVAFDVGPLATALTGVGHATRGMLDALGERPEAVEIAPYLTSWRAQAPQGGRRLPLPAALARRWWSRSTRVPLDRWLSAPGRPIDVVHGTNYVVPPARAGRVVSVYDCWFLRHPDLVHPDVARAGSVLRRAVAAGALVHVSSEATAHGVRELLGEVCVTVVPLGAPPARPVVERVPARVENLRSRRFVLALGTVERRKNLVRLVHAFRAVASDRSDLHLVIAGSPSDDSRAVTEAIATLGPDLVTRIHVTGRVDDDTRDWLLQNAAVLAYPSLDEGFGFPLLEAMVADTPVVAARAGSIPEVVNDAARLHDPHDVDALAEALAEVLDDETAASRLRVAGHRRVAEHPWSATASGLLALYARAAMERHPR